MNSNVIPLNMKTAATIKLNVVQDSLNNQANQELEFNGISNKPKNFLHHLHKVVNKKDQLPSYFIFYPTNRCNLSCSHCFYQDSLNTKANELH